MSLSYKNISLKCERYIMNKVLSPEHYAKDIFTSLDLSVPVDVYSVSDKFNIEIVFDNLSDAEAYFICKNANKKIIIDKKVQYESRIKFTIAHEIGHFYLPWHNFDIFKCSTKDISSFKSHNILENEANTFASELLVPIDELVKDINNKNISMTLIKNLAQKYGVSLTSLAIKAIKNTDDNTAVVFTQDGKIKWSFPSKTFKREIITNNIRQWSYAYDFFAEGNINEVKDTVYSMAWLIDGSDCESIIEESLPMPNINSVLTLLKISEENCEVDEDEF